MDVKNSEDVGTVVAEIIEIEGKIDIVVNNAGIQKFGEQHQEIPSWKSSPLILWHLAPVIDLAIADDQDIFETNVISVLRVCKTVVPAMAKRKSGLIINIGSIVGEVCAKGILSYCFLNLYSQGTSMERRVRCLESRSALYHRDSLHGMQTLKYQRYAHHYWRCYI